MLVRHMLLSRKYRSADPMGDAGGAPASGGSDVQTDWGDVSDMNEDGGDVSVPAAAPESTVQATPVATPEPVVAPVTPVAAEPVVAPPQAQAEPVAQPTAPVDIAALRKDYETQLVSHYGMDAETAQRLQTEPELVLPQLAARVHLEVLDAVMAQLPQRMTSMLTQFNESTARETEAEGTFFGAYPDLKGHKDAVIRVGQMYRAANPKATKEQAVKAIGDFVRQSLGLLAPVASTVAPTAPVNPFTPAGGAGGGAAVPQLSEWDMMIRDDD